MPHIASTVAAIEQAPSQNARVQLLRRVPEEYGVAQHRDVYAEIARQVFVPALTPDFGYVFPRPEYDLPRVLEGYRSAHTATAGFTRTDVDTLAEAVRTDPRTTIVWRLIVAYTPTEFAQATKLLAEELGARPVTDARIKQLEGGEGRPATDAEARMIAEVTARAVDRTLWPAPEDGRRLKQDRPDLEHGWTTIASFAEYGVPLQVFLHQRNYGGAFRQLLDATGSKRGDVLEQELEDECVARGIPFIRTGAHNQAEIERRFGLTVRPAPDFVFFDASDTVRAVCEVKLTNDGGTARDKAGRFSLLRGESQRLGGFPVFGLLDGVGWARVSDALGPVVRDCDGRVFTRSTLPDMFDADPFPQLAGLL
ncbi:hypothetical protein [Modestobacter sp. KNN46-3]|uniref:hypothetical protein n=1 Tax=Modestobacter sp. KNN46-3 TaxID=2711218 RepID=UPI0013DF0E2C|nr:hypothetical protein [Modestobacter sp. KNN46-3]